MIWTNDILKSDLLIVDDEAADVLLLERMLSSAGYTSIASTSDPLKVCELHRQHRYDLILLNLEMPGMSGLQVLEGLKEIEADGPLPVLAIAAQACDNARAMRAGAKEFVSKPFNRVRVLTRVRDILKARLRRLDAKNHSSAELRWTEEGFRLMVESVTDCAIAQLDARGRVLSWNSGAQRMKGWSAEEIIGQHFFRFYTREDIERGAPQRDLGLAAKGRFETQGWRARKDASRFWASVVFTAIRDADGGLRGFAELTRDLTERGRVEAELTNAKTVAEEANRVAQKSEARLRTITDNMPALISYFDAGQILRFVNKPDAQRVTGRTMKQVLGNDEYAKREPHIEAALRGERVMFERCMSRSGRDQHLQIDYVPEFGDAREVVGVFALTQDITGRKQNEERLESAALHDSLTGLANRQLLADRVSLAIAHARRNKSAMAVLYLDLDGFKQVNETLGHDAGDSLLKMVAERLVAAVREVDTVSRLGGDEFVIALWQVGGAGDATRVASKVIKAVSKPCDIGGRTVNITVSAGVGIYPAHGQDAATLLKSADLALHDAKHSGKNAYRVFDGEPVIASVSQAL
jgi:diguanylate cyclase (GGDEF)-like protein/PAS domain S-box-containing protein